MPRPSKPRAFVRREAGKAWQIPLDTRELEAVLSMMCAACGVTSSVELTLADDAVISNANEAFLGCVGPTNILSFPAAGLPRQTREAPPPAALLLSLDTMQRECMLYRQNATEHTLRLLAHGMTHLAGLDHGDSMEEMEKMALSAATAVLATLRQEDGPPAA